MNSKISNQTDTQATLNVSLDEAALKPVVKQTFERLRQSVKAAGFRPGKAPDAIVERELGQQQVQAEILEAAVQHGYEQALKRHDLPVIAPPEVKLSKFVPYTELEFDAIVDILPQVQLPDLSKIKVTKPEIKVESKEIDGVIEDLQRRVAKKETVDRPAKKGDEVRFDFEGKKDGQPVAGAASKNYTLQLGSGQFIPGFEDLMIGLKAGDEKTFDITFPDDYQEKSLAGQLVAFTVNIHEVFEVKLPEVNDDFAADVSQFPSIKDMRQDIEAKIREEKQQQAENDYDNLLLGELVKNSQLTVPPKLAERQLEGLKNEMEQNLAYRGLDLEKYLQLSNKTQDDLEKDLRPEADKRVAIALILNAVAKAEKLTLTNEEVDAELQRLKSQYTDPQIQQQLSSPQIREEVYNHLLSSKALATIKKKVEK